MRAKKSATTHKASASVEKQPPANGGRKSAPAKPVTSAKPAPPAPDARVARGNANGGNLKGLRVRMYRIGFGDFFLLTVPTAAGPRHILIDCGVHAGDIGSIKDAVDQMAEETGRNLSLIIMTHRHADHISGFATCKDVFSRFTVEQVWMSWFEDPGNKTAANFQKSLTDVAVQLHAALALRTDAEGARLATVAQNITGAPMALGAGSSNEVALGVLHGGFKNQAPVTYYQAGDSPKLPQDLVDAGLSAQILGPPIDETLVSQMDNRNRQYLANNDQVDSASIRPFEEFEIGEPQYEDNDNQPLFRTNELKDIEKSVNGVQPDLLAARAGQADNTLNNQSLVVLFTFAGKNLLFVGDAQWGNWENFLFGGAMGTPGHSALTDRSKSILGTLDFYKVGHHGSTNATPKDVVDALGDGCVAMCSTQPGAYGDPARGTEVPRIPLLSALQEKTKNRLVRSDQIPANGTAKTAGLPDPPQIFVRPPDGKLFIDYDF